MTKRQSDKPDFNIWQLLWLLICIWLAFKIGGWEGAVAGIIAFWLAAPSFR